MLLFTKWFVVITVSGIGMAFLFHNYLVMEVAVTLIIT